jgi:hypothetical protein
VLVYPLRCRRCHRPIRRPGDHRARQLHHHCYVAARAAGELDQYPLLRSLVDPVRRAELEAQGLPTVTIALRLDVTTSAVRVARCRARRAAPPGDQSPPA